MQINKDITSKNIKRVGHGYKVGDKVMINNNAEYRYGTPHKGKVMITQCCTNVMVTLHYVPK